LLLASSPPAQTGAGFTVSEVKSKVKCGHE
jgi:hypothetical protein